MSHKYEGCSNTCGLFLILLISILLCSCESYNFLQPQPVDKVSIYEFPKEFQGYWVDDDSETVFISSNYLWFVMKGSGKIISGEWPRVDKDRGLVFAPYSYNSFKTVKYDTLQNPIDTVVNYIKRGNHIYEVSAEGELGKYYPYYTQHDTFTIVKNDTTYIDLGHFANLRKLNHNFYVLNIRNYLLGNGNNWWQIFILEKKGNDVINLWNATSKLARHPSMFYEAKRNYYFDSEWTTEEILKLLQEDNFEMDSKLHRMHIPN